MSRSNTIGAMNDFHEEWIFMVPDWFVRVTWRWMAQLVSVYHQCSCHNNLFTCVKDSERLSVIFFLLKKKARKASAPLTAPLRIFMKYVTFRAHRLFFRFWCVDLLAFFYFETFLDPAPDYMLFGMCVWDLYFLVLFLLLTIHYCGYFDQNWCDVVLVVSRCHCLISSNLF